MSDATFQDYIASERDRLTQEAAALASERADIDEKMEEVRREFAAIDAYEAAKTGRVLRTATARKATADRRNWRGEILKLLPLSRYPGEGLSRGELLDAFGVKGNVSASMSVSNALTTMKRAGLIAHHNGRYYAVETQPELRAAE